MASAIEKVLQIAANNSFDNASVQTCLTAVSDLSANIDLLIGGAPAHLDTIKELADAIDNSGNIATNLIAKIDDLSTKVNSSSSGGGGLEARPQWSLNQTISRTNEPSVYSGVPYIDFGSGSYEYNNFGEGAMALNDYYFATAKSYDGNRITVFRRSNTTTAKFLLYTGIGISSSEYGQHTRWSMALDSDNMIFYGTSGYSSNKGRILMQDLPTRSNYVYLFPENDLSNNAYLGRGVTRTGDFLIATANGNATMGSSTGSIFIFKKDANGDFLDTAGNYSIIHGNTTNLTSLGANNGVINSDGDYFVTSARFKNTESPDTFRQGAVVYKKDAQDNWALHAYLNVGYHSSTTYNYAQDLDINANSNTIVAIGVNGRSINIFDLNGVRKQFIILSTLDRRYYITYLSDKYLITGYEHNTSNYAPILYKYSDPSWNKVLSVGEFLPSSTLEKTTNSRYGLMSAYHNNEIVLSQTYTDADPVSVAYNLGAIMNYKLSTDEVGVVSQDKMEVNEVVTKSFTIFDNEQLFKDKYDNKLPASKFINGTDDISINTIEFSDIHDIIPVKMGGYNDSVKNNSSTNLSQGIQGDCLSMFKDKIVIGYPNANYYISSNNTTPSNNGFVVYYEKVGMNWEKKQEILPSYNGYNADNFYFGKDTAINDNYLVIASSPNISGLKGGIRIYKKNAEGLWSASGIEYNSVTLSNASMGDMYSNSSGVKILEHSTQNSDYVWRFMLNGLKRENLHITYDNIILLASYSNVTSAKKIYVFYLNTDINKWDVTELIETDYLSTGSFGYSMASLNNEKTLFVGVPGVSTSQNNNSTKGKILRYTYTIDSSGKPTFTLAQTIEPQFLGDQIGNNIAVKNNWLIIGSPLSDYRQNSSQTSYRQGAVYIYKRAEGDASFSYHQRLVSVPSELTNIGSSKLAYFGNRIAITDNYIFTNFYNNATVTNYTSNENTSDQRKVAVWKYVGADNNPSENADWAFFKILDIDTGVDHSSGNLSYNLLQADDTSIIIARYYSKLFEIYHYPGGYLKLPNNKIVMGFKAHPTDMSGNIVMFGNINTNEVETKKVILNEITSLNNTLSVDKDISCNNILLNQATANKLLTSNISTSTSLNIESKSDMVFKNYYNTNINNPNPELRYGNFGIQAATTSDGINWLLVNRGYFTGVLHYNKIEMINLNSPSTAYFSYLDVNAIQQDTAVTGTTTVDNSKKFGDYGYSFAVYGDLLAISAPSFMKQADGEKNGRVFIIRYSSSSLNGNPNAWHTYLSQRIDPPDTAHYLSNTSLIYGFGSTMEMNNDYLFISYPHASHSSPPDDDNRYGMVFVYKRNNFQFDYVQTLKENIFYGNSYGKYGLKLALSGNYLAVSSNNAYNRGVPAEGRVYIYKLINSSWTRVAIVKQQDLTLSSSSLNLGEQLGLEGDYLFASGKISTDKLLIFVFKRKLGSEEFEQIKKIEITVDSSLRSWYSQTASTTQTDHKYPLQSSKFIYKNNTLIVPLPKLNKVFFYDSIKWEKIGEISGNTNENLSQSIEYYLDPSGVRNLYISSSRDTGDTNNQGHIKRYAFPEDITIKSLKKLSGAKVTKYLDVENIQGTTASFTNLKVNGSEVIPGNQVVKDDLGGISVNGVTTTNLSVENGDLVLTSNINKVQERYFTDNYYRTSNLYFGKNIRINGDYMFVSQYASARSITNPGANFPTVSNYFLNIYKKNSNNIFEKYTGDPSGGRIESPDFIPYDFADQGDFISKGDYLAVGATKHRNSSCIYI